MGRPLVTATNDSNPWWTIFKQAIEAAGGKLAKPEILSSTTDARFMRQMGIPTLGFSPMKNTPILLHDHNEVTQCSLSIIIVVFYLFSSMLIKVRIFLSWQFLKDSVYLNGIKVYEHVIRLLSSFDGATVSETK